MKEIKFWFSGSNQKLGIWDIEFPVTLNVKYHPGTTHGEPPEEEEADVISAWIDLESLEKSILENIKDADITDTSFDVHIDLKNNHIMSIRWENGNITEDEQFINNELLGIATDPNVESILISACKE